MKVAKKHSNVSERELAAISIRNNEDDDSEPNAITFMAHNSSIDGAWYLDSGATRHMSYDKSNVIKIRQGGKKIFMADGSFINEIGTGEALLSCENGSGGAQVVRVENLSLVPELTANLISVSQLVKNGFEVNFSSSGAKVSKNKKVLVVADLCNGLFKIRSRERALLTTTGGHKKYCIHQ